MKNQPIILLCAVLAGLVWSGCASTPPAAGSMGAIDFQKDMAAVRKNITTLEGDLKDRRSEQQRIQDEIDQIRKNLYAATEQLRDIKKKADELDWMQYSNAVRLSDAEQEVIAPKK